MSRYLGQWIDNPKPELVFDAAELWRDRCLLDNRSVFTDDKVLWNKGNLEELQMHFIKKFEEGEGDFFSRLETQLKPASPEAKQLAAEIYWVMMLIPYEYSVRHERKIGNIKRIWSWSGEPFPKEETLNERNPIDCLEPGLARMGISISKLQELLYYCIIWLPHWKLKRLEEQQDLINDHQKFSEDMHVWEKQRCDKGQDNINIQGLGGVCMRQIILYLLLPDYFETIFNKGDKEKIIVTFGKGDKRDGSNWIDDKLLWEIRQEEEQRRLFEGLRKDFHFYDADYQKKWNPSWKLPTQS